MMQTTSSSLENKGDPFPGTCICFLFHMYDIAGNGKKLLGSTCISYSIYVAGVSDNYRLVYPNGKA